MINLEKSKETMFESFTINLQKKVQSTGIEYELYSAVKFVPDISGSMSGLYNTGKVQKVLERLFVVALGLDDDGSMQVFPFSDMCERLTEEVTIKNYEGFVDNEIINKDKNYYFSGTEYLAFLKEIEKDYKGSNKKQFFRKTKIIPSLVLCIVDGDTENKAEVEAKIKELSKLPIFFIFFGIGRAKFKFLEKLDTMSGRDIDNAAFYNVNDIDDLSDSQLYDMISEQFINWFYELKTRGTI